MQNDRCFYLELDIVSIPQQLTGLEDPDYGPTSVVIPRESYTQPYKKDNMIYFYCEYVVDAGTFGLMQGERFYIGSKPAPAPDYSAEINFTGRYTDTNGNNFAMADIKLGADVAKAKVALVAGEWNETIKENIVNDSIESIEIEEASPVQLPCETQGVHTCVVVT